MARSLPSSHSFCLAMIRDELESTEMNFDEAEEDRGKQSNRRLRQHKLCSSGKLLKRNPSPSTHLNTSSLQEDFNASKINQFVDNSELIRPYNIDPNYNIHGVRFKDKGLTYQTCSFPASLYALA
ncbi:unnamed protein product [Dovyalis caffra]|uniref:Uncharacterized protein n=1 Tax=Dovyalis caffra TaxID=77055 RepID=A0AAV1RM02_9ROSI|nr:unnamed protein product [Dovyalis caffra]